MGIDRIVGLDEIPGSNRPGDGVQVYNGNPFSNIGGVFACPFHRP